MTAHRRRWPYLEVAAIADCQHALVTRSQLLALGVRRGSVDHAIAVGRLHLKYSGVYALVGPAALPPLAVEHAAVLACLENAHLSHRSAAAVWGFTAPWTGLVDVTVVGRRSGRQRRGMRIHRIPHLEPSDRRRYEGIRITSPARTLLDLASEFSDRELERAFDEAIATRVATRAAIHQVLRAYPHCHGAARLRELVAPDRSPTVTRSQAEELFLEIIRKAGLPDPEVNASVGRYEVDFCWRAQRIIVEVDGYAFHSSRAALERDHRRDAELQQLGFVVIRIGWRELTAEREKVLVRVAAALAVRGVA